MPSTWWERLDDLGLLGAVGLAVLAIVRYFPRWVHRCRVRKALRAAHVKGTIAALTGLLALDALAERGQDELDIVAHRAQIMQIIREARERLQQCLRGVR